MKFLFGLGWFQSVRKLYRVVSKRISKELAVGMAVLLAASASLLVFSSSAVAIDAIKVKYGAVDVSVTIPELVTFANSGQVSNQLRSLFQIAKATPDQISGFREVLSKKVDVAPNVLNDLLNSYYGKLALTEVSKYLTPGSNYARMVDDLKATVNLVIKDGQMSLLEVLQSYQGTDAIVIDGEKIVNLYNQAVVEGQKVLTFLRTSPEVQKTICKTA
ncbi:alpha/beta hydrolase [Kamptonema sp. UHCC 0994]|uniref:alpha/beta hydrolase n=1 Tax=Kamptonema sp. UHCC 0994 TaxID=3031329 RepID=UPI0023B94276|nr:alpha/beta hydrolase [Kamptonema sp. UHCC 0994]MDF0554989.1 alpha/beta hydrolase [Kamptonema sp. UHCC 0994]